MTRRYPRLRSPDRTPRPEPDVRRVLTNYDLARQRRAMRLLPDFFEGCHTHELRVLVTTSGAQRLRGELAIVLQDDGSVGGTEWIELPDEGVAEAVVGLMTIHASLASPMARVVDSRVPLRTRLCGVTVEQTLAAIVQSARDWAARFRALFADPCRWRLRALLLEFGRAVVTATELAERLDVELQLHEALHKYDVAARAVQEEAALVGVEGVR